MITLDRIQETYGLRIKKKVRFEIQKYLQDEKIQGLIRKALDYELDDQDSDWIFKNGMHKGLYPHLYWLCMIYIHPLTIGQHILKETDKMSKKFAGRDFLIKQNRMPEDE